MNEENIREIDFRDLLFQLLFRWRSILIFGLAGLLLLGGFRYYQAETKRQNYQKLAEAGSDATEALGSSYEKLKEELQENRRKIRALEVKITGKEADIKTAQGKVSECQDELENLEKKKGRTQLKLEYAEKKLADVQTYISDSLFMKLNPSEKPVAKRTFQVILEGDTEKNRELYRDPADEVVAAYTLNIDVLDSLKSLSEKYGLEEKYVRELYTVSNNTASNTVSVSATGENGQMALTILNAVCTSLENRKDEITSRYQEHTLKMVSDTFAVIIDDDLLTAQNEKNDLVLTHTASIDSAATSLTEIETGLVNTQAEIETQEAKIANLRNDITEYEEDIAALEKTCAETEASMQAKIPTVSSVRKTAVKSALIGLIAGIAAAVILYGLIYLLNGRMHTAEEVGHYYGLPVFAVLPAAQRKKTCGIDRLLYRLGGYGCTASAEEIYRTASVAVASLTGGMRSVVLLGTEDETLLQQTADALKEHIPSPEFAAAAEVLGNSSDAEKLKASDAVILCVERNRTKISMITEEISRAQLFGKKILGFIVA